jgi:transposase
MSYSKERTFFNRFKHTSKFSVGRENESLIQILLKRNYYLNQELLETKNFINNYMLQFQECNNYINKLETENKELKDKLELVEANQRVLLNMFFGTKGGTCKENPDKEKNSDKPANNNNTCETDDKKKPGGQYGHKGSGRKIPDNLKTVEEIIDVSDEKKTCPHCGKIAGEISGLEQESWEISCEKIYYLKKIIRKVFKPICNCEGTNKLIIAPPPPKIIPKGKYSIDFWVNCLINKYYLHLPINRQLLEMQMHGLFINAGSIFSGLKYLFNNYLIPLYDEMTIQLRNASHWHADESRWYVYLDIENKKNFMWFMWAFKSKDIVLFALDPSRAAKVPGKYLFDIDIEEMKKNDSLLENLTPDKIVNADRFSAYKTLQKLKLILIAYCWAHVRRDFEKVLIKYPKNEELCQWANEWIKKIANIYHINNERIKYPIDSIDYKNQNEKLVSALDQMHIDLNEDCNSQIQADIINSFNNHWSGLTIFVDKPEIPMDNNDIETKFKSVCLGRNNYSGCHSEWGGNLAAYVFSINHTCLINNICPKKYLYYYFSECAKLGKAPSKDKISDFLPHNLSPELKIKLKLDKKEKNIDSNV